MINLDKLKEWSFVLYGLPAFLKVTLSFVAFLVFLIFLYVLWKPSNLSEKSEGKEQLPNISEKSKEEEQLPNISFHKLAIYTIEVDKDVYQLGIVAKLFNADNQSYIINKFSFDKLIYNIHYIPGGLLSKMLKKDDKGDHIEDNAMPGNKYGYYRVKLPYKYFSANLAGFPRDDMPSADISITGNWYVTVSKKILPIEPEFYGKFNRVVSKIEWDDLLKRKLENHPDYLSYQKKSIQIQKTKEHYYHFLFNPDRTAEKMNFSGIHQSKIVKNKNGAMVCFYGNGVPLLIDGWVLLGKTYNEIWSDPVKLKLYNSIYPPDKNGKPKPFIILSGNAKEMIGE